MHAPSLAPRCPPGRLQPGPGRHVPQLWRAGHWPGRLPTSLLPRWVLHAQACCMPGRPQDAPDSSQLPRLQARSAPGRPDHVLLPRELRRCRACCRPVRLWAAAALPGLGWGRMLRCCRLRRQAALLTLRCAHGGQCGGLACCLSGRWRPGWRSALGALRLARAGWGGSLGGWCAKRAGPLRGSTTP